MSSPEHDADATPTRPSGRQGPGWLETASPWVSAAAAVVFAALFVIHLLEVLHGTERTTIAIVLLVAYVLFTVLYAIRAVRGFRRRAAR